MVIKKCFNNINIIQINIRISGNIRSVVKDCSRSVDVGTIPKWIDYLIFLLYVSSGRGTSKNTDESGEGLWPYNNSLD